MRVRRRTAVNTTPSGTSGKNAKGKATTEVAMRNKTRCARPNQVPTATTGPKRSRHRSTVLERAANVSLPSCTTKIEAVDRNQLIEDQISQRRRIVAAAKKTASPGRGLDFVETKPATMTAPMAAAAAARPNAARMKYSPARDRSRQLWLVSAATSTEVWGVVVAVVLVKCNACSRM